MKLENVTAKIRPRARWESIDLGCAMTRRNFGTIMASWMVTVLPFWVGFIILTGTFMSPGWHLFSSVIWCWGTLSITDRVPLLILSRNLFGEKITVWEVTKLWWTKLWYKQFIDRFFARFSTNRGLSLPVSELEGLKGASYKMRVNLLARNGGDGATQAAMVGLLLVFLMICSCYMFLMMIYQLYGESDVMTLMFEDLGKHSGDYQGYWQFFLFYLLVLSVLEPFFVGAGFAMYVNSRTVTEGWDIELSFKRMSERISGMYAQSTKSVLTLLLSLGVFLSCGISNSSEAADERVDEIMKSEDFEVHRTSYKEFVPGSGSTKKARPSSSGGGGSGGSSSSSRSSSSSSGIGAIFQGLMLVVFWCLVGVVAVAIIWVIIKNRYALKKGIKKSKVQDTAPKVKSVMGMDITPESLPKELHEEARAAWLRGDHQLAMSLLYRGAISWMVNRAAVPIIESDTEQDCVLRVYSGDEAAIANSNYFKQLTGNWVKLAYGRYLPADSEVMQLCDTWPFENTNTNTNTNTNRKGGL